MTPNEIAATLAKLSRELDELVAQYKALELDAAKAKNEYEKTEARAYLKASGPVEARKRLALLESSDEKFAADVAERLVKACDKALKALHSRIDVGRSLTATARDEMKMLGATT